MSGAGGASAGGRGGGGAQAGGATSGGTSAGGANTGGANACTISECFVANTCLDKCGGTVVYAGCCDCVAPAVSQNTCGGSGNQ
jgi:hypothetical protein